MTKLTLSIFLSLSFSFVHSQQDILIFKKKSRSIHKYWEGAIITFLTKDKQWQKGEITRIRNDSFYIRPRVVKYNFIGTDTFHFDVRGFSLSDVFAIPKKGYLIDYVNGEFQIIRYAGHVHFYWVKSGWLFRTGALGYSGLHVANGLINNSLSMKTSKTPLLIASSAFLAGVLMKINYKPYLRIGNKYQLKMLKISS